MVVLGIVSIGLGISFLLIFIGVYGLIIFMIPYSKPIRHLVEVILGADLALLNRPIDTTPWWKLLSSLLLIFLRIGMIVAGILVFLAQGFKGQNLIWLLFYR